MTVFSKTTYLLAINRRLTGCVGKAVLPYRPAHHRIIRPISLRGGREEEGAAAGVSQLQRLPPAAGQEDVQPWGGEGVQGGQGRAFSAAGV